MAKSNASEMLTSLDSLFTTQEQRDDAKLKKIYEILENGITEEE